MTLYYVELESDNKDAFIEHWLHRFKRSVSFYHTFEGRLDVDQVVPLVVCSALLEMLLCVGASYLGWKPKSDKTRPLGRAIKIAISHGVIGETNAARLAAFLKIRNATIHDLDYILAENDVWRLRELVLPKEAAKLAEDSRSINQIPLAIEAVSLYGKVLDFAFDEMEKRVRARYCIPVRSGRTT